VCVCVRERECGRERVNVCVYLRVSECEGEIVCVYMCDD